MTTSLLFHVFGLREQKVLRTDFTHSSVIFKVKTKKEKLQCALCKSFHVTKAGVKPRTFKGLPIGFRQVHISMEVQRVKCHCCGFIRQKHLSFAASKKHYTRAFERYVHTLSQLTTIKAIAENLKVSWDTVKEIQKQKLRRRYPKRNFTGLRKIAIDEFAVKKGHTYKTVVIDLDTGEIVYVGEGKDKNALEAFWAKLKKQNVTLEAVAIDMGPAYWSAVQDNQPQAAIIFDHFHIRKLINETLTNIRRGLYNQEEKTQVRDVLKGTRWLLLKNQENLTEEKNEYRRLNDALEMNKPLATAYYLKEELKLLWYQKSKEKAAHFLKQWTDKAFVSKIQQLKTFANTLLAHKRGILAWYDYPISTGPLEGLNNKIKTMKRQAYGYRDQEFFTLKLYALHKKNYALIG